jgi:hypothetical protein
MRSILHTAIVCLSLVGCSDPPVVGDSAKVEASATTSAKNAAPVVSSATSATSAAKPAEKVGDLGEKLGGELIDVAFKDPAVVAKQNAVFEKVFADPEVAAAIQELVQNVVSDPAIQKHFEQIMMKAVEDPKVVAAIKKLAAGATDPADVSARVEKHVSQAMEAPAVDAAIEAGVGALMDDPAIDGRFQAIFAGADVSSLLGDLSDPAFAEAEKQIDERHAKAVAAGTEDAFLTAWKDAASKDPSVKAAAVAFASSAFDGLPQTPEFERVMVEGLKSKRTKDILVAALAEVLADPAAKNQMTKMFTTLLGDSKNAAAIAKEADLVFKQEKFKLRMRKALVELLASEKGSAALQSAIVNSMKRGEAGRSLTAFVLAVLKSAPA